MEKAAHYAPATEFAGPAEYRSRGGEPEIVVIGMDPATTVSGWAVLGLGNGAEWVLKAGVFAPGADHGRLGILAELFEWAGQMVSEWRPALVAVETVYHGPNPKTTIRLAEVGAVVRLGALLCGGEVCDVAPADRCRALGLAGNASKAEVLTAVNRIYSCELTDHNAADAVAVASAGGRHLRRVALGLADA